ncbi:dTMP kinase [Shimazuella sp. AN120528]|uniref:dTMP kinase n=1 Tax=Shimazuella soli TaxID=1892854 RepID=UPI001F0E6647|nr:dTMP kinase [Shimazuella soli]MCH5586328.1 dTMP kinase [Shimazuella soli]
MLIAFCGIDGSGKTTQLKRVQSELESMQFDVYTTKQPSNWYRSDSRVKQLMNSENDLDELLLRELALFSAADRLRHYQTEIQPILKRGSIVLTDRYVFSAYAYFHARGISDMEWLIDINKYVPLPDMTIFLDIPVEIAIDRIISRDVESANKEELNKDRMNQIREIFLAQPWSKENYYIIDGTQQLEMITANILSYVKNYLNRLEV